jgi:hypothetical protein
LIHTSITGRPLRADPAPSTGAGRVAGRPHHTPGQPTRSTVVFTACSHPLS